jgi:hypothetical protein
VEGAPEFADRLGRSRPAGALAKLPANSGWYSLTGGALEQPARASTAASSGK